MPTYPKAEGSTCSSLTGYPNAVTKHLTSKWLWQVLPKWAQKTLRAHQGDRREIKSQQQLEQGTTGDEIWDALQHQLNTTGACAGLCLQGRNKDRGFVDIVAGVQLTQAQAVLVRDAS